jgi:hypothetical protein
VNSSRFPDQIDQQHDQHNDSTPAKKPKPGYILTSTPLARMSSNRMRHDMGNGAENGSTYRRWGETLCPGHTRPRQQFAGQYEEQEKDPHGTSGLRTGLAEDLSEMRGRELPGQDSNLDKERTKIALVALRRFYRLLRHTAPSCA